MHLSLGTRMLHLVRLMLSSATPSKSLAAGHLEHYASVVVARLVPVFD
jgi:hypothetical protein